MWEQIFAHAHAPPGSDIIHRHHGVAGHAERRERIGERHALGNRGAVIAVGEPAAHIVHLEILDDRQPGSLELRRWRGRLRNSCGPVDNALAGRRRGRAIEQRAIPQQQPQYQHQAYNCGLQSHLVSSLN